MIVDHSVRGILSQRLIINQTNVLAHLDRRHSDILAHLGEDLVEFECLLNIAVIEVFLVNDQLLRIKRRSAHGFRHWPPPSLEEFRAVANLGKDISKGDKVYVFPYKFIRKILEDFKAVVRLKFKCLKLITVIR